MVQLKPGDPAPDFEATTDEGTQVRLSDFRGQQVILFFYPKDNTSGCTTQACGFRDSSNEIFAKNAMILGVSPDTESSHQMFRSKYDLPFNLLVDSEHEIANAYGVWGEKSMYGRKYMGIIRSHFVINEEGHIADTRIKISPKKSPVAALAALG